MTLHQTTLDKIERYLNANNTKKSKNPKYSELMLLQEEFLSPELEQQNKNTLELINKMLNNADSENC